MKLTDEQKAVLYAIVTSIRKEDVLKVTLGGYAGTGKSTLMKYLVQFFPNFGVCAYTGKAANVLRKKGVAGATTIHSRIYKPFFDNGVVHWDLTDDPGCGGFLVDEASMVGSDIYHDLLTFGLPMVFVGDHGQLEPIDSSLNLMEDPDYTLEEIHRNAGDIPRFAERLRKGYPARGFKCEDGSVQFVNDRTMTDELLTEVDQVICAFNKTRVALNTRIRKALGFEGTLNIGERVMCLRNNRKMQLFNGMQGIVVGLSEGRYGRKYMDFEFDNTIWEGLPYDPSQFGQETYKIKHGDNSANPFDYAYTSTAHRYQGDEAPKILVVEQKCSKWSHRRWGYTAASRAKELLYWKISPY